VVRYGLDASVSEQGPCEHGVTSWMTVSSQERLPHGVC